MFSENKLEMHRKLRYQCCADCGRYQPRTWIRSFFCGRGRSADLMKQPRTRTVRGSKLHLAHIKLTLRSSGRMYPAKRQIMQLQARAECASAAHVSSEAGVRKSSVTWRVSKDAINRAQLTRPHSPVIPQSTLPSDWVWRWGPSWRRPASHRALSGSCQAPTTGVIGCGQYIYTQSIMRDGLLWTLENVLNNYQSDRIS